MKAANYIIWMALHSLLSTLLGRELNAAAIGCQCDYGMWFELFSQQRHR